jgi:hypothetical protein
MNITWFKCDTKFFDNEKIKYIIEMPEGGMLFYLWQCLLGIAICEPIPGIINPKFGSVEKRLIIRLGLKENIIKMGLSLFSSNELDMTLTLEDGSLEIKNFADFQSLDKIEYKRTLQRLNKRKQRAKTANKEKELKQIEYDIENLKHNESLKDVSMDSLDDCHCEVIESPHAEQSRADKNKKEKNKQNKNPDSTTMNYYFNVWLMENHNTNVFNLDMSPQRKLLYADFAISDYYKKEVPGYLKKS